jgi:hypothetical protein
MNDIGWQKFINESFWKLKPIVMLKILSLILGSHKCFPLKYFADIPPPLLEIQVV